MTDDFLKVYNNIIEDVGSGVYANNCLYVSAKLYRYTLYLSMFRHFLNINSVKICLDYSRQDLEYGFTNKQELISDTRQFFE